MATVNITIGADADVKVEVVGAVGKSCKDLTRAIEKAIGQTTGDTLKPEFMQSAAQPQQAKAGA